MAKKLALQVGDHVLACFLGEPPRYRKLLITGIYKIGISALEEKLIYCDLHLIQQINSWSDSLATGFQIFLANLSKAQELEIENKLIDLVDPEVEICDTIEDYLALFDTITLIKKNVFLFSILVSIIASFSLMAVLFTKIMEKNAMVTILKVLGASPFQLVCIFLGNNLQIVGKGLLSANLFFLFVKSLQKSLEICCLKQVSFNWNWATLLWINLIVAIVTVSILLLTLWYSFKALDKKPIV